MKKRPLSITIIGWLFIAVGAIALVAGLLKPPHSVDDLKVYLFDFWLVSLIRPVALLSGVFVLSGLNWARWLLAVWMGYHIILSMLHSPFELVVHSLLFGLVLYFLFRPTSSEYFRSARGETVGLAKGARPTLHA